MMSNALMVAKPRESATRNSSGLLNPDNHVEYGFYPKSNVEGDTEKEFRVLFGNVNGYRSIVFACEDHPLIVEIQESLGYFYTSIFAQIFPKEFSILHEGLIVKRSVIPTKSLDKILVVKNDFTLTNLETMFFLFASSSFPFITSTLPVEEKVRIVRAHAAEFNKTVFDDENKIFAAMNAWCSRLGFDNFNLMKRELLSSECVSELLADRQLLEDFKKFAFFSNIHLFENEVSTRIKDMDYRNHSLNDPGMSRTGWGIFAISTTANFMKFWTV